MNIVDQRYLDGTNRYCTEPCLLSILDLGHPAPYSTADMDRLRARLKSVLPGLRQGRSLIGVVGEDMSPADDDANCDGLQLARLIQGVAIELHRLAGDEVMIGFVGRVPKMAGRYRLILPFRCGTVANASLSLAIGLIDALLAGREFALNEGLDELRRVAIGAEHLPAAASVVPSAPEVRVDAVAARAMANRAFSARSNASRIAA
ncbi:hypothetical protein IP91_00962 [Pseudoduganella lurida]|uniref:Cyanophycin synthase-like N-terminal domain-containing protein n=1 Tax=Pseudoduganella lurida TaxID=1036180 RepID=A0A562RLG6_9BURK|nr:hypothetical protein [Pseudoduganella lurida]TWI69888.1 hypothetical protein IP91_00962 [Pseudoduganella lurida]